VNKMDLVGFGEETFRKIEGDFSGFVTKLDGAEAYFIPTCSTAGDNVVTRSTRIPWFEGMTLLEYLENTSVSSILHSGRLRLPVQFVIRTEGQPRRYAGQIASGLLRNGDTIRVLPSERTTRVQSIRIGDSELNVAVSPQSVAISLEHDLDIARGDMIIGGEAPEVSRRFKAMLLWSGHGSLEAGRPYLLKQTTRQVCAIVTRVNSVLNPTTLKREPSDKLEVNEFGEVEIETHQPLYYDPYGPNCKTGAFVIIDSLGNGTVGAGMITTGEQSTLRPSRISGRGLTVWFTGLSSAGKSTISRIVYEKLWVMGHKVEWLDGDVMRQHLNRGLSFTKADRDENVRRSGFVAELLTRHGVIALVSVISPYRSVRDEIRQQIVNFVEVYVNAALSVCEERDLKGVYRRARTGEIRGVTGIDDPYERPIVPEVECRTDFETPIESATRVLNAILPLVGQRTDD
jgi:bifunctional enzyme CysN/CysC